VKGHEERVATALLEGKCRFRSTMMGVTQADLEQSRILLPVFTVVVVVLALVTGSSTMIAISAGAVGVAILAMRVGGLAAIFTCVVGIAIVLL
jgi:hypothetical protein